MPGVFVHEHRSTNQMERELVWCPDVGFTMSDLFQDGVGLFRPDERFGILVSDPDEIFDRHDEFRDAAENSATNAFPRDLSEPPLHQVQPGRTGRREMKVETRMLFQPRFDPGMVVRAVVVQNLWMANSAGTAPSICRRNFLNSMFRYPDYRSR